MEIGLKSVSESPLLARLNEFKIGKLATFYQLR